MSNNSIFAWRTYSIKQSGPVREDKERQPVYLRGRYDQYWYQNETMEAVCFGVQPMLHWQTKWMKQFATQLEATATKFFYFNEVIDPTRVPMPKIIIKVTPVPVTDNLSHDKVIPSKGCTCGIYGYKNFANCLYDVPLIQNPVIGVVEMWGKVIPAELGYRAQYAKLRAVIRNPLVATTYQVPNLPSYEYGEREYFS
jgi:hypothetical protein